jgi:hypothetical protein
MARFKEAMEWRDAGQNLGPLPPVLKCPKCGGPLIRVRVTSEKELAMHQKYSCNICPFKYFVTLKRPHLEGKWYIASGASHDI